MDVVRIGIIGLGNMGRHHINYLTNNEISGAIIRKQDLSHGRVRTEILCSHCEGHLGHIFEGENYTKNNIRHCVNSLSIKFVPFNKNWKNKVDIIADKYIISKNQLLLFLKKSDQ